MIPRRAWIIPFLAVCFLVALKARGHTAEGHTHDGALGKFYQSWMQPDHPAVSCCSDEDCFPTASRMVNGHWQAQEPEGSWVDIPDEKVEQLRDSPDGRSHMCGRNLFKGFAVFCFARGGGA